MNKYFSQKLIELEDSEGRSIKFFMRPIKVKELNVINQISMLQDGEDSEEYITGLLLDLVIGSLSINGKNIPERAARGLIEKFIDFNFPEQKKDKIKMNDDGKSSDKQELSFYIDFLVSQGHSVSDIMEYTIEQFNELVKAAANRLNPPKKVMDPLTAFKKIGIPIRKG